MSYHSDRLTAHTICSDISAIALPRA